MELIHKEKFEIVEALCFITICFVLLCFVVFDSFRSIFFITPMVRSS